jgi:DNA-binding NarL/FixJ family response regulator
MGTIRPATQPLAIFVLSGSYLVRLGFAKIFEGDKSFRLVGTCPLKTRLEDCLTDDQPDVVIVDMETEGNIMGLMQKIRKSAPYSKVILLCGFEDKDRAREAFDNGADGIILKVQPPAVVMAAVEALYHHTKPDQPQGNGAGMIEAGLNSGGSVMTDTNLLKWPGALTEREREIIILVGQGLSNKDIADRLCISGITVRHHLTSIFDKVGVSNRQKLLIRAHGFGLSLQ